MKTDLKRQNFNITPEQEAEIARLQEMIGAPTVKDTILSAVEVYSAVVRAVQDGGTICSICENGKETRLVIPQIEKLARREWKYLVERPHAWRRQLYVKGRKLRAFTVWMDMLGNDMTREEAADDWDLPLEAIDEIVSYCRQNEALLKAEADEERHRLLTKGVVLEPPTSHRRRQSA